MKFGIGQPLTRVEDSRLLTGNGLYNDDIVYIDGYNDAFKVTLYENNTIRYIPY